jgi:glutathione S-transferase
MIALGALIRCSYAGYPNIERWMKNMKALKTWPKVHETVDGFAASLKDKPFVAI